MTATKSPLRQHSLRVLVPVPPKGIMVEIRNHLLRKQTLNAFPPGVGPARHLAHARRACLLLQLRTVAAEIEQGIEGDDTACPRLL